MYREEQHNQNNQNLFRSFVKPANEGIPKNHTWSEPNHQKSISNQNSISSTNKENKEEDPTNNIISRIQNIEYMAERMFKGLNSIIDNLKDPLGNASFSSASNISRPSEIGNNSFTIEKDLAIDKKFEEIIKIPKKEIPFTVPRKANASVKCNHEDANKTSPIPPVQQKRKSSGPTPSPKKLLITSPKPTSLANPFQDLVNDLKHKKFTKSIKLSSFSKKIIGSNSITFESAFTYKIKCVCTPPNKCSICLDMRTISTHRLFELICKMGNCYDKELLTIRYALIIWKLASLERRSEMPLLNLPTILLQMLKGIQKCQSNNLSFQDMSKHYVVLVCAIIDNKGVYQLILSNGFHTIMTEEYSNIPQSNIGLIYNLIVSKKINVGMKLHIINSDLQPNISSSKLLSIKNLKMILYYNRIKRAHKNEKLGVKKYGLVKSINSISLIGNVVECVDVIILKVYPILVEEGTKLSTHHSINKKSKLKSSVANKYSCIVICIDSLQFNRGKFKKSKNNCTYIKFESTNSTDFDILKVGHRHRIHKLTPGSYEKPIYKFLTFIATIQNIKEIETKEISERIYQKYYSNPTYFINNKIEKHLHARELTFSSLYIKKLKKSSYLLYESRCFYIIKMPTNSNVFHGMKENACIKVENALFNYVVKKTIENSEVIISPKTTDLISKCSKFVLCFYLDFTSFTSITKCDDKIEAPLSEDVDIFKNR